MSLFFVRALLLLVLPSVFLSTLAHGAGGSAKILNYKAYWLPAQKVHSRVGQANVTVEWSQRVLPLKGKLIPVATLTMGEIKSKTGEAFPKDFAGAVAQLTHIKKWKQENRGSYMAFEAAMPEQGRYLKVFISKTNDSYKYSIASIRLAFMLPTYFEAELIQREQIGDLKGIAELQNSTNKYASYYRMLMQPAHAVGVDWIINYLTNWQTTANNGVSAVNNVAGAGNNLAGAGNNIAGAGNNVASAIQGATGIVQNEMAATRQVFSDSVNTVKDIDKTLKGFQDPKKMGKVAFAAGLGGALGAGLGGLLVQFATDGAASVTREMYYLITGDLKPETRNEITGRARQAWDALEILSRRATELDKQMQLQMAAMYLATGVDPMSPNDVNARIKVLESDLRKLNKSIDEEVNPSARLACAARQTAVEEQLALLRNVKPILLAQKNGGDMCSSFERMYEQWVDIEGEIQEARSIILNDTFSLIRQADSQQQYASKALSSEREEKNECDFADGIKTSRSYISKYSCICNAQVLSENCRSACNSYEKYSEASRICLNTTKAGRGLDPLVEQERLSELALNKARSLQRRQEQLVASNGNYAKMQTQMTTHFKDVMAQCGSKTTVDLPADVARGKQKAEALLNSDLPIASAKMENMPAHKEGGGFLAGIMNFFKRLFGG